MKELILNNRATSYAFKNVLTKEATKNYFSSIHDPIVNQVLKIEF